MTRHISGTLVVIRAFWVEEVITAAGCVGKDRRNGGREGGAQLQVYRNSQINPEHFRIHPASDHEPHFFSHTWLNELMSASLACENASLQAGFSHFLQTVISATCKKAVCICHKCSLPSPPLPSLAAENDCISHTRTPTPQCILRHLSCLYCVFFAAFFLLCVCVFLFFFDGDSRHLSSCGGMPEISEGCRESSLPVCDE